MTAIYDLQEGARNIMTYKHNQSPNMSKFINPELPRSKSQMKKIDGRHRIRLKQLEDQV